MMNFINNFISQSSHSNEKIDKHQKNNSYRPKNAMFIEDLKFENIQDIEGAVLLGSGSFGSVYKIQYRGLDVAIKILHVQNELSNKSLLDEAQVMQRLRHPNVCLLLGYYINNDSLNPCKSFIMTEYVKGGNLSQLLHDHEMNIPLLDRLVIARDIAVAMNWMHNSNPSILHRDLKSSNVMIDAYGKIKICDFGLSYTNYNPQDYVQCDKSSVKGTPLWMAPELLLNQPYNTKTDVYSFGIVLWEIITRKEPYINHIHPDMFTYSIIYNQERPIIPLDINPSIAHLMNKCWEHEESKRPNMYNIIQSLSHCITNCTIFDYSGLSFWNDNFLHEDYLTHVPWNVFIKKLMKHLNMTEDFTKSYAASLFRKCLRHILIDNNENINNFPTVSRTNVKEEYLLVSLSNYARMVNHFGPLLPLMQHNNNNNINNTNITTGPSPMVVENFHELYHNKKLCLSDAQDSVEDQKIKFNNENKLMNNITGIHKRLSSLSIDHTANETNTFPIFEPSILTDKYLGYIYYKKIDGNNNNNNNHSSNDNYFSPAKPHSLYLWPWENTSLAVDSYEKFKLTSSMFINRLMALFSQPWFHGCISKTVAERRLIINKAATFLIRYSEVPDMLALSYVENTKTRRIIHKNIKVLSTSPKYTLNGVKKYETLDELIKDHDLLYPCHGSIYQILFYGFDKI